MNNPIAPKRERLEILLGLSMFFTIPVFGIVKGTGNFYLLVISLLAIPIYFFIPGRRGVDYTELERYVEIISGVEESYEKFTRGFIGSLEMAFCFIYRENICCVDKLDQRVYSAYERSQKGYLKEPDLETLLILPSTEINKTIADLVAASREAKKYYLELLSKKGS